MLPPADQRSATRARPIHLKSEAGYPLPPTTFQHCKLDMSILSVRKMVKRGGKVEFDGKGGVYFVKTYVQPPPGTDMPGFGGPGSGCSKNIGGSP